MNNNKRYDYLIKTMKEIQLCCDEQDCIKTIEDLNKVLEIIINEVNKWILENERPKKN